MLRRSVSSTLAPLFFAGYSVVVAIHLHVRAMLEEPGGLLAGMHLRTVGPAVTTIAGGTDSRRRRRPAAPRSAPRAPAPARTRPPAPDRRRNGHGATGASRRRRGRCRRRSTGRDAPCLATPLPRPFQAPAPAIVSGGSA